MTAVLILVVGIVLLGLGYIVYGSWLAKKWGVNPDRPTPAHTKFDNKDFVPANPAVLMGHHFSSIAGAGPINGPIQAAVFGWLPVSSGSSSAVSSSAPCTTSALCSPPSATAAAPSARS